MPAVHVRPEGDIRPPGYAPMPGDNDFRVPTSPYVAPPAAKSEKQSLIFNLDGRQFASVVFDHGANYLSRPSSGPNGTDLRISPVMPGMAIG